MKTQKPLKTRQEIHDRIEDIENARSELNDMGNLSKEHFDEFRIKIDTLEWVLGLKNETT